MKDRLVAVRNALGMKQRELADVIGYARGYVASLESGERKINDRIKRVICERLKVNPEWFETGSGNMFSPPTVSEAETARLYLMRRIQNLPDDLKEEILDFCADLLKREQYFDKKNDAGTVSIAEDESENAESEADPEDIQDVA